MDSNNFKKSTLQAEEVTNEESIETNENVAETQIVSAGIVWDEEKPTEPIVSDIPNEAQPEITEPEGSTTDDILSTVKDTNNTKVGSTYDFTLAGNDITVGEVEAYVERKNELDFNFYLDALKESELLSPEAIEKIETKEALWTIISNFTEEQGAQLTEGIRKAATTSAHAQAHRVAETVSRDTATEIFSGLRSMSNDERENAEFKVASEILKEGVSYGEKCDTVVEDTTDIPSFYAAIGGLYNTKLISSGFTAIHRRPSNKEVQAVIDTAKTNSDDIKYSLGGHGLLIMGAELKRLLLNLFHDCIISCSLQGYKDINVFMYHLDMFDADSIAHSLTKAYFGDVFESNLYCFNCDHTEQVRLAYSKLKLIDFNIVTSEMITLCNRTKVTDDDLKKYREKYHVENNIKLDEHVTLHLGHLSAAEFFEEYERNKVYLQTNLAQLTPRAVNQVSNEVYFSSCLPFIKRVSVLRNGHTTSFVRNDKTNELFNTVVVDQLQDNPDIATQILLQMDRQNPIKIAYDQFQCPDCGASSGNRNNFVELNAIRYFFTSGMRKELN